MYEGARTGHGKSTSEGTNTIIIIVIIIIACANHPYLQSKTELRKGTAHDIGLKAYKGASGCRYTVHVSCRSTAPQLDVN